MTKAPVQTNSAGWRILSNTNTKTLAMNLPQAGIALGVLTLLFGGDIYGMFAGQSFEVWFDLLPM